MSLTTLLLLAVALGTDAMSLCVAIGLGGVNRRQVWTFTIMVLIFHIVMPIAGFYLGAMVGNYLNQVATFVGSFILLYLGINMIKEAMKKERTAKIILANFWGMMLLALSVSVDALSVGFTLGTQKVNLLQASLTIGLMAGLMTYVGLVFGRYLGKKLGRWAQGFGGVVLLGIGVKLFF